jgi:DNA-directed RNA polymerase specialized sigma24 family protein
MAAEHTDAELYALATTGDATALESLIERYLPQLHAFVRLRLGALRARESSMDIVQSVCRELLASRERFEFHGEDRFRAWLFTVIAEVMGRSEEATRQLLSRALVRLARELRSRGVELDGNG